VIVRVLGEGQYELSDDRLEELNSQDERLAAALENKDEATFRAALQALVGLLRSEGVRLPDSELVPSDIVLPRPDASLEEVAKMLGHDGLVPG